MITENAALITVYEYRGSYLLIKTKYFLNCWHVYILNIKKE